MIGAVIGTVIFMIAFIVLSYLAIVHGIDVAWLVTPFVILAYAIYITIELGYWQS